MIELSLSEDEDRASAADAKTPVAAECVTCGFVWDFAWVPMDLERFAALARAAKCPKGCRAGPRLRVA